MTTKFDLVPTEATGTRRAVLIGINYVGHNPGQLSGWYAIYFRFAIAHPAVFVPFFSHNDVMNMLQYIKDVHGFEDGNITVLLDKDGYTQPTKENILNAYKQLVEASQSGDALFCHYSGHGTKMKDEDGDEKVSFECLMLEMRY
jgi:metacaspase-1